MIRIIVLLKNWTQWLQYHFHWGDIIIILWWWIYQVASYHLLARKRKMYNMLLVSSEKKRMRRCCRSSPNGIVWWYQFISIWLLPVMALLCYPNFSWRERFLLLLLLPDLGCIEMMLIFTLHINLELPLWKQSLDTVPHAIEPSIKE